MHVVREGIKSHMVDAAVRLPIRFVKLLHVVKSLRLFLLSLSLSLSLCRSLSLSRCLFLSLSFSLSVE